MGRIKEGVTNYCSMKCFASIPRNAERDQEIIELARQGLKRTEIAVRVGMTPQRIQQICKPLGIIFATNHLPRMERLMRRVIVRENGCWEWQGGSDQHGYGIVNLGGGKWSRAHRVAYEAHHGVTLETSQHLLHRCDNPPCINPAHMFVGNPAINHWDCLTKFRSGTNRLTPDQVLAIREELPSNGNRELAEKYGVNRSAIERIRKGKSWRWLDEALRLKAEREFSLALKG